MESTMDIGFIGIGQMGKHMSRHILEEGYKVTVHDLVKVAAVPIFEKEARSADTPAELAKTCNIVLSSLPNPQDMEQIVYGTNGLKSGWKEGDIYINMSTNTPTTIRRIARDAQAIGVAVLDAPVSGGTRTTEACTLAIMVGGDSASLEKARNILETMGQRIFAIGGVGCGNITKLTNNMIPLICNSISAEGFVLGVKAGIDPEILLEIIKASTSDNWCARQYSMTTFKGNFEPRFKVGLAYKDISLALTYSKEYGVPLPVRIAV